jgi:hypothetical protein
VDVVLSLFTPTPRPCQQTAGVVRLMSTLPFESVLPATEHQSYTGGLFPEALPKRPSSIIVAGHGRGPRCETVSGREAECLPGELGGLVAL